METSYALVPSPMGDLMIVANDSALTGLHFRPAPQKDWTLDPKHPVLKKAAKELAEYFAGKRTGFTVPLHFAGTDFQNRVWQQIARIPYGQTISYSELAKRAGKPDAVRAAGSNTGSNPIAVIIPCHRVLHKGGGIGGFGGGLDRKRFLLGLEQKVSG